MPYKQATDDFFRALEAEAATAALSPSITDSDPSSPSIEMLQKMKIGKQQAEIAQLKEQIRQLTNETNYLHTAIKQAEEQNAFQNRELEKMISYAASLPPSANSQAQTIKIMIHDLFINDISQEQHTRLFSVGRKDALTTIHDIHHNQAVSINQKP